MTVLIPEAVGVAESAAAGGTSSAAGGGVRAAASRKAGTAAKADRGAGSPAAKRAASRVAAPTRTPAGPGGGRAGGGGGSSGRASSTPFKKPAAKKSPPKKTAPKKPAGPSGGKGNGKDKSGGPRFVPKDASKLVLAEFVVCMVILILSPLTSKGSQDLDKQGAIHVTLKASALAFIFFVLALISAGGRNASRVAAGFGGVITLGYVVSQADVFAQVAKLFPVPSTQPSSSAGAPGGHALPNS
jgi:hypothetical protein